MDSSYNKDKRAKGVYEDGIYFGSMSEKKLYDILREHDEHYKLDVHKPVIMHEPTSYKWKVDFTLTPVGYESFKSLRELLYICNGEFPTECINEIYIEYKGWNDENFKKHMTFLISQNSDILRKLIIVSDYPSAYIHEYIHSKSRYQKLICSLKAFKFWINDVY